VIIICILVQLVYIVTVKNSSKEQLETFTKKNLQDQALLAEDYIIKNGIESLKEFSEKLKNRVTVINATGKVLYDSRKEGAEEELDSHRYRDELKNSFEGKEGFAVRFSRTLNKELVYYSLPIRNQKIIRVALDYRLVREKVEKSVKNTVLFFILLNLTLFLLYKFYLMNYYKGKIISMKNALNNDGEVVEIYLEDDQTLKSFWGVVKKWQERNLENIKKIEEETEKLKEIISAIDMSIVVINGNDEILLKNNEAEKSIMNANISKNMYYEKINYIEIIKFFNKLKDEQDTIKEQIYISESKKYYFAYGKYLRSRDLYLVAVKDITKDKELDEIQRRFITNISHELKTPLTNIKGYIVAMAQEEEQELKNRFLDIIEKNIEKIENMIKDFLNISKAENMKVLNIYPVNIHDITEAIQKSLAVLIEEKQAQLIFQLDIQDKNNYINVDKEKIVLILKNLIENSIIYSEKLPKVIIRIEENDIEYKFGVEDNGIGIPKDSLSNIFERFYRVDNARTSNMAGTGLGLSIVEEVVKNYQGTIHVDSKEGIGTKLNFTVPKL